MNIRHILLIDDHALFRDGLRMLLNQSNPGGQVSEANSIEQALALDIAPPVLALLDIRLPGVSGIEGVSLLKQRWPDMVVVVLSALDLPEGLAHGTEGYVSKREDAGCLLERIAQAMARGSHVTTAAPPVISSLTPRQREVLDLLSQGLSNKLIARRLSTAENTIRRHVQDILVFFGVDSRMEAVSAARRRGLVD